MLDGNVECFDLGDMDFVNVFVVEIEEVVNFIDLGKLFVIFLGELVCDVIRICYL